MAESFLDQHVISYDVSSFPMQLVCRCGFWDRAWTAEDLFALGSEHKATEWDAVEARIEAEYERQREAGLL